MEEIDIKKNQKKGMYLLFFSALLVLCTFVALEELHIAKIRETLYRADPIYLLVSTICMSFAFLGMGFRWRALMPCTPPILPLSGIVCAGLLLNYATPGPLGELAAAYFASKRYPLSLSQALASGVVARLVGLISAALTGAVIWFFFPLEITEELYLPLQLITIFCLLLGLGLLSLFLFSNQWIRFSSWLEPKQQTNMGRWYNVKYKLASALSHLCRDISHLSISPKSSYTKALFWSFFSHCSVISGIAFLAMAFQTTYSFAGIIFTYTVTTAGAVLLFALPGSYIGWDALFLGLLLSSAEIEQSASIAIVGVVRLQQLGYMLLGGFSLNWLINKNKHQ